MKPDITQAAQEQLQKLQVLFHEQLPTKLDAIENAFSALTAMPDSGPALETLYRLIHNLAGSAGTFGAKQVTQEALLLDKLLKPLLVQTTPVAEEILDTIAEHLTITRQLINQWDPNSTNPLLGRKYICKEVKDNNLIYIVEDDTLLAQQLIAEFESSNYEVQHFVDTGTFHKAYNHRIPSIIIMDMIFEEGEYAGADILRSIDTNASRLPPVIFISVRKDMEARLAAQRAGATRYFHKPLNINKLHACVDGLTNHYIKEPFRVLVIDDDPTLGNYYCEIMEIAGIKARYCGDPMQALEFIEDFDPELILLDIYMPNVSGLEVASVIRQDDKLAQMPIVFLSTETELDKQLAAMHLGGDDFLTKPVDAEHLIASIIARVKRSRWIHHLNDDLKFALQEIEYRQIALDQHSIVSVTNTNGTITDVNQKFIDISGYSRNELIGQNHRMISSGIHSPEFFVDMWQTISDGNVWNGEICNRAKNGHLYWVEATIVPFLDSEGLPYKYVAIRTDITILMETQRALEISEVRLKRSQEFANIGTWDWDIQTGELFWSNRIGPLFGYHKAIPDTTYENFINAIHPDDRDKVTAAVNNCVENNSEYNVEHRVVWDNGTIHWMLEQGDVVRDKDGAPLHMLGVVQDITYRKHAELALKESEAKLSSLFELSPLGIVLTDMNGKYLEFNEAFRNICGYGTNELKSLDYWTLTPKEYEKQEKIQLESMAKTGRYGPYEKVYLRKDGKQIPIRLNGMLVTNKQGEQQIWSIVEDISDTKQAEMELIAARDEAQKANRAKSQFLSSMSHELRTPMNAILGFGQLLEMDALNTEQQDYVQEILKAGNHLLELINEVLDLSKIESGRLELSMETVCFSDTLAECRSLLNPMLQNHDITLETDDIACQPIYVHADAVRLKQVLINLISNAIKYNHPQGSIRITCQPDTDASNIRINVIDTGIGLNDAAQASLFIPFSRIDDNQHSIEGTGIGLVITKNLLKLMGGEIGVTSEPGVGSTFWFTLPLAVTDNDSLARTSTETNESHTSALTNTQRQYSILYIEDNPTNLRLIEQVLSRWPHIHLSAAHEPFLGIELIKTNRPDLVLLDINLPGIDGYEVFARLQADRETKNIPVIAVSANAMPRDIERGLQAGFHDYVTKPIQVAAFLTSISNVLELPPENPTI